jgi:hypothetical protein
MIERMLGRIRPGACAVIEVFSLIVLLLAYLDRNAGVMMLAGILYLQCVMNWRRK